MKKLALLGLLALVCARHHAREPVRIATFNIEDFPKDAHQVAAAFDELAATHASIIALQEISDVPLVERTAQARLGPSWRAAFAGERRWDIGVLYDSARWELRGTVVHDETRLDGRHKPTLEARLAHDGEVLHVFVVHLKSGGDYFAIRERQLRALDAILRASDGPAIVLGDFNATGDADRGALRRLASSTGLVWASEPLACTAFWSRSDGCPTSRLDHVLASSHADSIEALGACATDGCAWRASCPLYRDEVSDHCPVVASFSIAGR